jgi:hypothetical protein
VKYRNEVRAFVFGWEPESEVRTCAARSSDICALFSRERERERALSGFSHNGGSRASPAHGLRITITEEFDSVREEEGEKEEDVFEFNDITEGSRAPATQA